MKNEREIAYPQDAEGYQWIVVNRQFFMALLATTISTIFTFGTAAVMALDAMEQQFNDLIESRTLRLDYVFAGNHDAGRFIMNRCMTSSSRQAARAASPMPHDPSSLFSPYTHISAISTLSQSLFFLQKFYFPINNVYICDDKIA